MIINRRRTKQKKPQNQRKNGRKKELKHCGKCAKLRANGMRRKEGERIRGREDRFLGVVALFLPLSTFPPLIWETLKPKEPYQTSPQRVTLLYRLISAQHSPQRSGSFGPLVDVVRLVRLVSGIGLVLSCLGWSGAGAANGAARATGAQENEKGAESWRGHGYGVISCTHFPQSKLLQKHDHLLWSFVFQMPLKTTLVFLLLFQKKLLSMIAIFVLRTRRCLVRQFELFLHFFLQPF